MRCLLLFLVFVLIGDVICDLPPDHAPIRVNKQTPQRSTNTPTDQSTNQPTRQRPQFAIPVPTHPSINQPELQLPLDHRIPNAFIEPSLPPINQSINQSNNASLISLNGTCSMFTQQNYVWQICPYGRILRGHTNELGVLGVPSLIGVFDRLVDGSIDQLFNQGDLCHHTTPINQSTELSNQTLRLTLRCNESLSNNDQSINQIAEVSPCQYQAWMQSKAACQFVNQSINQPISFRQLIDETLADSTETSTNQSTIQQCLKAMIDVAHFIENVESPISTKVENLKNICKYHWQQSINQSNNQGDDLKTQSTAIEHGANQSIDQSTDITTQSVNEDAPQRLEQD